MKKGGKAAKTRNFTEFPLAKASYSLSVHDPRDLPRPGAPEIAFAGRSNAGKSSAINALARQTRLAYASRTPGRTREINFFRLRSGALIADLPGYGYAAVPRALKEAWQEFLWTYVTTRSTLIGLVVVVDARHGLKPLDMDVLAVFMASGRPLLVLATKSDKLNQADRRAAVRAIEAQLGAAFAVHANTATVVAFSATSRQGVEAADMVLARWLAS